MIRFLVGSLFFILLLPFWVAGFVYEDRMWGR